MLCPQCNHEMVDGPKAFIRLRDPGSSMGFEAKGYSCYKCNLTIWPYQITVGELVNGTDRQQVKSENV